MYIQRTMNRTRQTRELTRRLGKLTEAQAALGWGIILVLVALLGAIYLNQVSNIASSGRRAQLLQFDLDTLQRENSEISRKIAIEQSLSRLQQEAAQMGFVQSQPSDLDYIKIQDYPARQPFATNIQPIIIEEPFIPSTMRGALWEALKGVFNDLTQGESSE